MVGNTQERYALYQRMLQDLNDALEASHWPPPLIRSTSTAPSTGGGGAPSPSEGGGLKSPFAGFGGAGSPPSDPSLLPRINGLMSCLNRLQVGGKGRCFHVYLWLEI